MSEVFTPITYQLGIGGLGGFLVGYVVKKILKIAIILGGFIFAAMYFAYSDVIKVDYGTLSDSISSHLGSAWAFLTPLLSNLPFLSSFVLGLMLGLKTG